MTLGVRRRAVSSAVTTSGGGRGCRSLRLARRRWPARKNSPAGDTRRRGSWRGSSGDRGACDRNRGTRGPANRRRSAIRSALRGCASPACGRWPGLRCRKPTRRSSRRKTPHRAARAVNILKPHCVSWMSGRTRLPHQRVEHPPHRVTIEGFADAARRRAFAGADRDVAVARHRVEEPREFVDRHRQIGVAQERSSPRLASMPARTAPPLPRCGSR